MSNPATKRRREPRVAWRALQRLIKDPERTEEVFVIVRSLSGDALERGYARFTAVPARSEWLERSLLTVLGDRARLRDLPAGSLGRAYLDFVERESLDADGLVQASEEGGIAIEDPALRRYAERTRDMHDIWHVLTGYERDPFGEVCLLAFTYAQTRNLGIGVIALVGTLKFVSLLGGSVFRAAWQGWRAGRRAAWLPGEDWEALLREPLEDVRARLTIVSPTAYLALRSPRFAGATG